MSTPSNVIFVGGPGSGKSNYLFRTWIAIERNTGRLVPNGLPAELAYLHNGAATLLDGQFAPHTSKDTRELCEVPIAERERPDFASTLVIPDATGELWLDLYSKREWPLQWDKLVTAHCGFVLFICVGSPHNVAPMDWIACERFYGSGVKPEPTDVPTQVLLVEWLQILRSIANKNVGGSYKPRLSVVITAWDRVPSDRRQESPQNYLETEFPLLAQFIRAGAHGFHAKVFGLSIVGGDLQRDSEFRHRYLRSEPSILGYSVWDAKIASEPNGDVLMPIYWALGLEA
jgi:hypothetical protein